MPGSGMVWSLKSEKVVAVVQRMITVVLVEVEVVWFYLELCR